MSKNDKNLKQKTLALLIENEILLGEQYVNNKRGQNKNL